MRRLRWWMCGLVVLAICVSPLVAGEAREVKVEPAKPKRVKPPRKPKSPIRGYWAILVKQLGDSFTPEQRTKLEAALKAKNESLAAWNKEKGKEYKDLDDARREARKNKNEEAFKELSAKVKVLRGEKAEIEKQANARIDAVFTDEQRAKRKELDFYNRKARRYAGVKLTAEQKQKVRGLCDAACKQLATAKGKERKAIEQKLHEDIEALFTPEQKATWRQLQFFYSTVRRYGRAKLTKQQRQQVRMLCDTAVTDMAKAEAQQLKDSIEQKLHADIDALLTAEQRERMKAPRAPKKPRPKAPRPAPGAPAK